MIETFPYLALLFILPLFGVLFVCFTSKKDGQNALNLYLLIAITELLLVLILAIGFDFNNPDKFQYKEAFQLSDNPVFFWKAAVDGKSLLMIILTCLLSFINAVYSLFKKSERLKEYVISFLLAHSFAIAVFIAADLMMFFIFFEAIIIPIALIIAVFGDENKIYAAYKYFIFSFIATILMLAAIIIIYANTKTMDINAIAKFNMPKNIQQICFWLIFLSMAIKIPLFPFHLWLPDAHSKAPVAGSIFLAGIIIKMGLFGVIKVILPIFPFVFNLYQPFLLVIGVITILYAAFCAAAQDDFKKMIAFSSITHMGLAFLALVVDAHKGVDAAVFLMFSHGLVISGLFIIAGFFYDNYHSTDFKVLSGKLRKTTNFNIVLLVLIMATVGFPVTSGFIGEIMSFKVIFNYNNYAAFIVILMVIINTVYCFNAYKILVFNHLSDDLENKELKGISLLILTFLVLLILIIGIYPNLILSFL